MEKRCAHCGEAKDIGCFQKNRRMSDGFSHYCRECKKAASKLDRERHWEARKAGQRAYHEANREREISRTKQWELANPDHNTWGDRKQKARVRGIPWNLSLEWFRENIWGKPCRYCGDEQKGGIDRIDNRLGYEPSNCVPCCSWCNSIKMEHTVDEMRAHLRKMIASG
jgi:hypothetical protein